MAKKLIRVAWTDANGKEASQWATVADAPKVVKALEALGLTNIRHE